MADLPNCRAAGETKAECPHPPNRIYQHEIDGLKCADCMQPVDQHGFCDPTFVTRPAKTKAEWVPPEPVESESDGMHIVQLDHPDYLATGSTPEEARLNFWKGLALTFWERWKAGLPLDCEPHQSPVKSNCQPSAPSVAGALTTEPSPGGTYEGSGPAAGGADPSSGGDHG